MPLFSSLVLAVAGPSGHGKSALVRRLTGVDTDRLPEEKRQGLTTDLGFAPLPLPDGSLAGLIDLPGHERFARNMIAGAAAANAALLVVAADRGVEPGAREQAAVLELLGITRVVACITHSDASTAGRAAQTEGEVRELLRETRFQEAEVLRVSGVTGEGCEALRRAISALEGNEPEPFGIFRMPLLRAFQGRSAGTVLTGVPLSGKAAEGDLLQLLPGGPSYRVGRVESYHIQAADARPGRSAALHFPDLRPSEAERGMVVAVPGHLRASTVIQARLRHTSRGTPPLRPGDAVRFHCGAAESIGALHLLEGRELTHGRDGLVEIRLLDSVAVAAGDRFILRFQSPPAFVGGGVVLEARAEVAATPRPRILEALRVRETGLASAETRVEAELRLLDAPPAIEELARNALMRVEEAKLIVAQLTARGVLAALPGDRFSHVATLTAARTEIIRALESAAKRDPAALGVEPGALQVGTALEPGIFAVASGALLAERRIAQDRGFLRIAGHVPAAGGELEQLRSEIRALLLASPFNTPRLEELPRRLGREAGAVFGAVNRMAQEGEVVRLRDGVLLHRDAIERAKSEAVRLGRAKGEVNPGDFRDALGTTRKYVIPLLEHLEAAGVTARRDGTHYLKS